MVQWAWQTLDKGDRMAHVSSRIRTFGEVGGVEKLTTANWAADEHDGWEMTALAAYLCGAEGL